MCSVFNFLQQHMLFYALMAMCNQLQMFPTHESHSTVQTTHGGGSEEHFGPSAHGATLFLM